LKVHVPFYFLPEKLPFYICLCYIYNQSSKLEKFIKPILRTNIIKMAITMRTLVAFVFTIFFIISFVHSRTTTSGAALFLYLTF